MAAFLLRLIWILFIPSRPISDFELMYSSASDVAKGNYSVFHGTSYFARFAHNTIAVLYFSVFHKLSASPLILIKVMNTIFQTLAVYFTYLLVHEMYNNKKVAAQSAFLLAVFPPFIMYSSQVVSENIAIPFYIFSMYCFLKGTNRDKPPFFLIFAGIALSIANLFRMVGMVFLVAYILYFFLYKGILSSIKKVFMITLPFLILLYIVSSTLLNAGITDTHLWASKEPSTTSILKGTNINSFGQWNSEDASLPDKLNFDTAAIKKESMKIIKERLTTTPIYRLLPFYIAKLSAQWGFGDYGAYVWTIPDAENSPMSDFFKDNHSLVMIVSNLFLIILLNKTFKVYLRNKNYISFNYLSTIIFGGFVSLYLITEMQPRYSFIIAWLLVIIGHAQYSSLDLEEK